MSTKSTIFLTHDNEHCYSDCTDVVEDEKGNPHHKITLELSKKNIDIVCDDSEDLIVEIKNPDSNLFKLFNNLRDYGYDYIIKNDL